MGFARASARLGCQLGSASTADASRKERPRHVRVGGEPILDAWAIVGLPRANQDAQRLYWVAQAATATSFIRAQLSS